MKSRPIAGEEFQGLPFALLASFGPTEEADPIEEGIGEPVEEIVGEPSEEVLKVTKVTKAVHTGVYEGQDDRE